MSHPQPKVLLGTILQQAGLVSARQIEQALEQQRQTESDRPIGEILASQGRIDPKTADFFAERWSGLLRDRPKQPLGQYFKQAALLNESQIQAILDEQRQTKRKFGELAIAKGWLKPATVDFFLRSLGSKPSFSERFDERASYRTNEFEYGKKVHEGFLNIKRKLLNVDSQQNYSEQTLDRVLLWTGGQTYLTQKLFQLLSERYQALTPGREVEQIDRLVQIKLLDNWQHNELGTHLNNIEDRLINNQHCHPDRLLRLYQQILTETVALDYSREQQELINMGLVVKQGDRLTVANRIYQSVFNIGWVTNILTRPSATNKLQATPLSAESSTERPPQARKSLLKIRNVLILLTLIGLLTILVNAIAKRRAVKLAFQNGNELLKQKSFTEAVAQYNRLLKIDSNYFQAWTNRGYALAGLEKYEAMRESCSTATIVEPTAVYAWNCQGEALHNLQRYSEAIAAFDRANALDRTNPIFLINKSESLNAQGKHEESLTVIEEAIEALKQIEAASGKKNVSSEFAVALSFLGNGYRRKEQYSDAIDAYDRALSYSPNYFPAQIGKGITLSRAKRYREAEAVFQGILENPQLTSKQQAQTWFYLGKALCSSQRNSLGIAAFERSLNLEPGYEIAEQAKEQCT